MQQMLLANMNSSLCVLGLVSFGLLHAMAQDNALSTTQRPNASINKPRKLYRLREFASYVSELLLHLRSISNKVLALACINGQRFSK